MSPHKALIKAEFSQAQQVLNVFVSDENNFAQIEAAAQTIASALLAGGKVLSCGNGGSHCDAMHFAEELSGRYRENRPAYAAMAISDPSHISCVGNDFGYEYIFSRFIEGMGKSGDVVVGLSTSGTSKSVVRAFEAAKQKGMKTILLSGKTGRDLAALADVKILVPHEGFADRIQEIHIKCIHSIILIVEQLMAEQQ
ncbi:D-sedoheptulose 7-phosphate isomerase [Reichenbachiella carrageenanivorans]|uniref:Phosphoheptose isomerase n=1 Tax=Reichenbachiella carrageenanivorans TaxID=2979869 RepID=A0ABY6D4D5_9BACT|nr:D-sedoheptulose 7-phosphate isomerase [Reichenbachiella carrageenanivorans]UXX81014.1 D-sedoheptulose 7-phosphate isomerase [Reichenbachiella carrageenanivorans]